MFLEKTIFTSKKTILQFGSVFSFMYFLLEQFITNSSKDVHTFSIQHDEKKYHSCMYTTPVIIAI
jgi:hypothetical protein